jgi:small conductance mechanosensitive channel
LGHFAVGFAPLGPCCGSHFFSEELEINMEEAVKKLVSEAVLFAPRAVASLVIFLALWFGGLIIQKIILRIGGKSELDQGLFELGGKVVKLGLITFGAVTALGTMGINISALVASLGLTGFALGFALRDALSNALAGVLILVYRPFHRNDTIAVTGFEGVVIQIDLRYTTIQSGGNKILIPNSTIFTNPIRVMGTTE